MAKGKVNIIRGPKTQYEPRKKNTFKTHFNLKNNIWGGGWMGEGRVGGFLGEQRSKSGEKRENASDTRNGKRLS